MDRNRIFFLKKGLKAHFSQLRLQNIIKMYNKCHRSLSLERQRYPWRYSHTSLPWSTIGVKKELDDGGDCNFGTFMNRSTFSDRTVMVPPKCACVTVSAAIRSEFRILTFAHTAFPAPVTPSVPWTAAVSCGSALHIRVTSAAPWTPADTGSPVRTSSTVPLLRSTSESSSPST